MASGTWRWVARLAGRQNQYGRAKQYTRVRQVQIGWEFICILTPKKIVTCKSSGLWFVGSTYVRNLSVVKVSAWVDLAMLEQLLARCNWLTVDSAIFVPFWEKSADEEKKDWRQGNRGGYVRGYNRAFVLFEVSNLVIDCHALLIRVVRWNACSEKS